MRDNYKYNGWTNYATWRINLELIDINQDYWFSVIDNLKKDYENADAFVDGDDIKKMFSIRRKSEIINELMDNIKNDIEDTILNSTNTKKGHDIHDNFAYNYALAFVSDVNYYEIAEALVDGHDIGKMFFKYKLERTSEE